MMKRLIQCAIQYAIRCAAPALAMILAVTSLVVAPLKHTAARTVARVVALEKKVIQEVSKASVQLGPVMVIKDKSGKEVLRWFGWGSGTIISKDGFIITNNHVFDTAEIKATAKKAGGRLLEGRLMVLVTKRTDQPPVAAFIATGVYNDARLDLAVLKITQDLSGQEVNADELNLPFVPLGNSDEIDLGDKINIFGYPGIGGDTITFTEGPVSGFASDPNVKGGRGWIKTSATIAGGNSGGTGVDESGKLIYGNRDGVPHRHRKVRYFEGWVVMYRGDRTANPNAQERNTLRNIVLHTEGRVLPLTWEDGRRSGYSLQLARLSFQDDMKLLTLKLLDDATGQPVSYVWADPHSTHIGMNLQWFQSGLTEVKGDSRFDPKPAPTPAGKPR